MSVIPWKAGPLVLSAAWAIGVVSAAVPPSPQAAAPSEAPLRLEILPPGARMAEAIQAERDKLSEQPSPFLIRKFEGHTGPVYAVAFSPDGKTIASCSGWPKGDKTVRLWDVASGKQTFRFDAPPMLAPGVAGNYEAPGEFTCVAFTPDGNHVLAGGVGGVLRMWDVKSGKVARDFEGHTGSVYAVVTLANGRNALSGGRDMTARLWDLKTGREVFRSPNTRSWVRGLAVTSDGLRALTAGQDGVMRMWDLKTGKELNAFVPSDGIMLALSMVPDVAQVLTANGYTIVLWDLERGRQVRCYRGHNACVRSVAVTPDGRRFLSAGEDHTVRLWDIETGRELALFAGHRGQVYGVAVSPDGLTAVSGGGARWSPTGPFEVGPGIDFALRLWKLP